MSDLTAMRFLVSFDLDSTLCNTGHRHTLIDRENGTDWRAYALACENDLPVAGPIEAARIMAQVPGAVVVGLSARDSHAAELTAEWMRKHGVPLERIFLDEGEPIEYGADYTHAQYKVSRLRQVEDIMGLKVRLHFDDYAEVAVEMEKQGIPCVCVRTPQEIEELVNTPRDLR